MSKYMKTVSVVVLALAVGFAAGVLVRIAQDVADRVPQICQCKQPTCKCECPNPTLVANVSSPNEEPWNLSPPVPVPVLTAGQVLILSHGQWITLARPNASAGEEFGDHCVADIRQRLVVLRTMGSLEALVRYESTDRDAGGTVCRDGTLGVLNVADFAIEEQDAAEVAKQRQRVEQALQGVR